MSPCGFALLPPFLVSLLAGRDHPGDAIDRALDALRLGALVSVGYAGVFLVAGLAVATGLRPLLRMVPWAAVVLGAGFVALGSAVALGRRINLRLPVADRVGGVVLVASGISLLAYWLPVLTRSSRPWAGPAGAVGAAVTGFLEARRGLMVALAAVLLVIAAGAGWVARRRSLATSAANDVEISPRS